MLEENTDGEGGGWGKGGVAKDRSERKAVAKERTGGVCVRLSFPYSLIP